MLDKTIKVTTSNHLRLMMAKRILGVSNVNDVIDELFEFLQLMALKSEASKAQKFKELFDKEVKVEASIDIEGTILEKVEGTE